jgi:hypothetical protein
MITRLSVPVTMLMIFCISSASAQIKVGFKAGIHSTTAHVLTPEGSNPSSDPSVGFHIGAQLRIPFEEKIFFLPQFQYAFKQFNIKYNNTDTASQELSIHYLEIPILLSYEPKPDQKGWFFQFGPSLSIAMKGNQKTMSAGGSTGDSAMKFAFNHYGRYEINLVANVGYKISRKIGVSAGYAYGLGSIVDDDYGPDIKPRMATLSVHYWLK